MTSDDAERIAAVLEFHRPSTDHGAFDPYCLGCWEEGGLDATTAYPCRTVRLLTA